MNDAIEQRAAWKIRLVEAIVGRTFDAETLVAMIEAGLDEAYREGMRDAADGLRRGGAHRLADAVLAGLMGPRRDLVDPAHIAAWQRVRIGHGKD